MRYIIRALFLPLLLGCSTMTQLPLQAQGQTAEGARLQLVGNANLDFHATAATISPYGNHVAVGGKGEAYILHDFRAGFKGGRDLADTEATTTSLLFSWDNKFLAGGDSDGIVRVWAVDDEQLLLETDGTRFTTGPETLGPPQPPSSPITALAWSTDSDTLVVGQGNGHVFEIRVKVEETRGNRPLTPEEMEFVPHLLRHSGLESGFYTQRVPISGLDAIQHDIRAIGSGPRQNQPAEGQAAGRQIGDILNFFSADVDCKSDSCFEFTRPGRYLTSLSGWQIAYLPVGGTELSIHQVMGGRKAMEKPTAIISLPPNQKSFPRIVNSLESLQKLALADLGVIDIALRNFLAKSDAHEILTLSPRLLSFWDIKTGAYTYAHVLDVPVFKAGFENYGNYLYTVAVKEPTPGQGEAAPAGGNAGGAVNEVLSVYYLWNKPGFKDKD